MTNGLADAALNPAESARARRVAAWCAEIAAKLDLPAAEREVLEQVVSLRQGTRLMLDAAGWNALREDLGIAPSQLEAHPTDASAGPSGRLKKLALILEQCDDLDAACELDAHISGEPELTGLDGIVSEVGAYFGGIADGDIQAAASRLPVFPAVAYRAITLLDNIEVNFDDVEALISTDQTLATHILRAANSALLNSATRIKTVRHAVTRIGLETARQIVSAASLRTMFASKHSQALWNHSLEVAEGAANLASRSGLVGREEAFLAGLVHDIGKLVILNLPTSSLACRKRLTESGCPGLIVERVILSASHAAIGAGLLRQWRFAESITECAKNHHTPEQSSAPLSSIVYLAELQTKPERELGSDWRHRLTLEKMGLVKDHIHPPASSHALSALRFTAAA